MTGASAQPFTYGGSAGVIDEVGDLYAVDGKIVAQPEQSVLDAAEVIDAKGLVVAPGLVDLHTHFRVPGQKHKETIFTGTSPPAARPFFRHTHRAHAVRASTRIDPHMAQKAAEQTTKDAEAPERDGPVLDLTDAAVKRMIKSAKARGYVTYDQLNAVLPSDEVTSERIEDIMAMLSEMGINVVESDEAEEEGETEPVDATDEDEGRAIAPQSSVPATTTRAEPTDRTDDPVRMYLREMGSVELLSREGEIAIAKRIEAGHEAMIAGLCESPLTFQAIIIWGDELNEARVLLRDIIDLDDPPAEEDAHRAVHADEVP